MTRNYFTGLLHEWVKEQKLTIDDTRLVKEKALEILAEHYPNYAGVLNLEVQYYKDGEYGIIPRNLITGLALCFELNNEDKLSDSDDLPQIFAGIKGAYEFNGKDFIFRPYVKPAGVFIHMVTRE